MHMAISPYRNLYKNPTVQVLLAIVLGIALGAYFPETGEAMKPLGDAFIKMIKMVIGPIIFLTIVTGISHVGDIGKVGKIGGKALIYFEIITTLGLVLGMVAMNVFKPGAGFDTAQAAKGDIAKFVNAGKEIHSASEFIMNIIPTILSARSLPAICCRCCSSRSYSGWRCRRWAKRVRRSVSRSINIRRSSSVS